MQMFFLHLKEVAVLKLTVYISITQLLKVNVNKNDFKLKKRKQGGYSLHAFFNSRQLQNRATSSFQNPLT